MTIKYGFRGFLAAAVIVGLQFANAPASGATIEEQGRALLEKHRDAVVTVELVIKQQISFGGQSQDDESKSEANGTVIDSSGLTVLSLSETDPSSLFENMMSGMGQMGNMNMESTVTDAKILLRDGTEIESEIVLRDKDLDLAFVRPIDKPAEPMPYIDLEASGAPQILDQVVSISRLGRVANRAHAASLERITAIVEKPRKFYLPGTDPTQTGLGSPAFTADGQVVGIFLMRSIKSSGGGGLMGMMSGARDNLAAIILPAVDILEASAQAPPFEDE